MTDFMLIEPIIDTAITLNGPAAPQVNRAFFMASDINNQYINEHQKEIEKALKCACCVYDEHILGRMMSDNTDDITFAHDFVGIVDAAKRCKDEELDKIIELGESGEEIPKELRKNFDMFSPRCLR